MRKLREIDVTGMARSAMFVAGVALVSYGCWLVYEPSGYIAAGTLLSCTAIAGTYLAEGRGK